MLIKTDRTRKSHEDVSTSDKLTVNLSTVPEKTSDKPPRVKSDIPEEIFVTDPTTRDPADKATVTAANIVICT